MYADVLISYEVKSLDKTFTYLIPDNLNIKVGMKVKVPFGKKKINGFVLSIKGSYDDNYELKTIDSIVDENFILSSELLKLGEFLKNKTLCSLMTAYETMLPKGFKARSIKYDYKSFDTYLVLNQDELDIKDYISKNKRYQSQIIILEDLLSQNKVLKREYNTSSVNTLIKKALIKEIKEQKYRINSISYVPDDLKFTEDQESAYNEIKKNLNTNKTFLIYGVTGSGKTLVYINLIKEVIKNNKTAILLVPEISLTTQIIQKFYDYFYDEVAIFHSGLSTGEKYDEYLKILNQEVKVVVGTRSAVFTPLENIGIIIIDEEHSDTYKQDNNPRYHARDIALERSKYHKCPLVLGSATPSLESMARAGKNVYELIKMESRVNNSLPVVTLVDMTNEIKKRNFIFSDLLLDKIKDRLNKKEQIILLLNRRGHSTFINCKNCGYVYKCPHCDISLTYHKSNNTLRCHYCGHTVFKSDICPKCHEDGLSYMGLGTEKLELELSNLFPNARIIRMDRDTTSNKGSHSKIINDFSDFKYDILLGTQMIAKGLDFPKVSLVGVINADTTLNIPDYKSNENTFALLNQVAGRAGRKDILGEVILQTFNIDNTTLNYVKNNNYLNYYDYEMDIRRILKYPPYVYLCSLKIVSKDYEIASQEANKVKEYLKNNLKNNEIILGPTTSLLFKIKNLYRFQIIIKYKKEQELIEILKELDDLYKLNRKVYLEIDLNANRI